MIHFLYISRGSAGESRSMLCLCERLPQFENFKFEISDLKSRGVSISKQLHGWLESLKNTEIKGVKFLTEESVKKSRAKSEMEEWKTERERIVAENIERTRRIHEENKAKRNSIDEEI